MNKHRRAKSRKVKETVRWYRRYGYKITYKEAKRINRKVDLITARLKSMPARLVKARKRLSYNIRHSGAAICHELQTHCEGHNAGFIAIDESTPIEQSPAWWDKENPYLGFETRRLGKFYFEEETE